MSEIKSVLAERGSRYGEFKDNARVSQNIKVAMQDGRWSELPADKAEALEMIAHKMARIINGDPEYIENFRDIAGYATLVMNSMMTTNGCTDSKVIEMVVKNGVLSEVD
jgi:hypothetical protein